MKDLLIVILLPLMIGVSIALFESGNVEKLLNEIVNVKETK
jgi:hypothetical protein